jgi:hypothetical protein
MKNVIIIDFDSEREAPIVFKKGESKPPETREEAGTMIKSDITLLVEGLAEMLHVADASGYQDMNTSIELIKEKFKL